MLKMPYNGGPVLCVLMLLSVVVVAYTCYDNVQYSVVIPYYRLYCSVASCTLRTTPALCVVYVGFYTNAAAFHYMVAFDTATSRKMWGFLRRLESCNG